MKKNKYNEKDIEDAFDKWLHQTVKDYDLSDYTMSSLMSYAWEGAIMYMTKKYKIKVK